MEMKFAGVSEYTIMIIRGEKVSLSFTIFGNK